MARHKKQEIEDQEPSKLDISSLIDVCFLLLIYFIAAMTMVQERKLDMAMPGSSATSGPKPELEPAFIRVDVAGGIYWGDGPSQLQLESDPNNHELESLYEKLDDLRQQAEGMNTKPIVQLYVEGGARNQRVVDVMNALTKAKIKTVGLSDVQED